MSQDSSHAGDSQKVPPRVFISYAWEGDSHKAWVRRLAENLVSGRVEVRLDQWHVKHGESLTQFMETEVTRADYVIVVCTPEYAKKSNYREGGVGYEQQIISGELILGVPRHRFLPLIRKGTFRHGDDHAIPTHFEGISAIDFRDDAAYEAKLDELLRAIYSKPKFAPPELGLEPHLPISNETELVTQDEPGKNDSKKYHRSKLPDEKLGVRRSSKGGWKKVLGYGVGLLVVTLSIFLFMKRDDLRKILIYFTSLRSQPRAGAILDAPLGIRMRYVPSGVYTIGSPEDEAGQVSDETPHQVRLTRGFWLAETELTQGQWSQLIPQNHSKFIACGADCPVDNISWYEAVEFANRVSDQEGLARCYQLRGCTTALGSGDFTCESATFTGFDCPGYRLPTEAEWEIAARAGTTTAIYTGAFTLRGLKNSPELDPIAWYGGNSRVSYPGAEDCSGWKERQYLAQYCGPHPVGQKQANPWGFRDMLGNVWEWTGDWYGEYAMHLVQDPTGPPTGSFRVFRGGSWSSLAHQARAAYRYRHDYATFRGRDLGLRLAACFRTPDNPRRGHCAEPF